jgi:hypothetical protein
MGERVLPEPGHSRGWPEALAKAGPAVTGNRRSWQDQTAPLQDRPAYAGIGSRATPAKALDSIEDISRHLARAGWTLRTGLSPGADQAFYRGAIAEHGCVELYLPWPAFEAGARSQTEGETVFVLPAPAEEARALAARFHPAWSTLSEQAHLLLARDVHQVLGRDLASPAALVVCWTPDGDLDGSGPRAGGTGQALRIACHREIEVINLAAPDHARRLSPYMVTD